MKGDVRVDNDGVWTEDDKGNWTQVMAEYRYPKMTEGWAPQHAHCSGCGLAIGINPLDGSREPHQCPLTEGKTLRFNPALELLVAYAIVHRGLRGQVARDWAKRCWVAMTRGEDAPLS